MSKQEVLRAAREMSSGTMATLTGLKRYDEIERAQWAAYEFINNSEIEFANAIEAVKAWKEAIA